MATTGITSFLCRHDDDLRETLQLVAEILQSTVVDSFAGTGRLLGYRVGAFDAVHLAHHARRLGIDWPRLDPRKYGNSHLLDLHQLIADDDCEHVVSRSLVSACRVYGVDVPDDDAKGADVAALWAVGDLHGIKTHCERDVLRTVRLAKRIGVLPARWMALDIETRADERMADALADVKLGNVKDPAKVAAARAEKEAAQRERMALDPWASIPVCVSWATHYSWAERERDEQAEIDAAAAEVTHA